MSDGPWPLYDQRGELSAWWIGQHIFSVNLDWVGFIYDGHAFSSRPSSKWLGPAKRGVLTDNKGHVIMWTPGERVIGEVSPYKPPRPSRPPRPERPVRPYMPPRPNLPPRPSDGWSQHSVKTWYADDVPAPRQPDATAGVSPNEITFDDDE